MNKRTLSQEQLERLAKLAAVPDEKIDTSDIPEMTDEQWASATRKHYRPTKQPVTIRLDSDIISWFKARAQDGPYQSEINRVLRRHVEQARKQRAG